MLPVVCVLAPCLLLLHDRMARIALRILLWCGAAMWAVNALAIARRRIAFGEPWIRMALILGGVSLFTAWAATVVSAQVESDPGADGGLTGPTCGGA